MKEQDIFSGAIMRSPSERRTQLNKATYDPSVTSDFMNYGFDYFDNIDVGYGYGGYHYDGRYKNSALKIIKDFDLPKGSTILEVGCAKGVILYELHKLGMNVTGVDASTYAITNGKEEIRDKLYHNTDEFLEYSDDAFDFVFAKEVIPHLEENAAVTLIKECVRVASNKQNVFLELQCVEDDLGAKMMKQWDPTHKTIKSDKWWISKLNDIGYQGAYHCKKLF